ncbi:hypothetical protein C2E23DRAFT_132779 [Lenzites betulinus]|nr:hypothetical protein C2E23DRAFT_132779 [Lenzites betulinus]
MLKRQRSTPSFVADVPYAAAPDPAIDAFERAAKRRRQIAPLRRRAATHGGRPWPTEETDGEEDVEGDEHAPGQAESSEQARRLEQAGDYRNVNTLLHDLHAEQRHRLLFSTPFPPSDLAFPHAHPHANHGSSPTMDKTIPTLSQSSGRIPDNAQSHPHMPSFTISLPSKDANMVDYGEVQRVTQRYEDTNRHVTPGLHDSFNPYAHTVAFLPQQIAWFSIPSSPEAVRYPRFLGPSLIRQY